MLAPHLVLREISSPSNHLLKQIRLLHERHGRDKSKLFLIEGAKLLNEALDKRIDIVDIAASDSFIKSGMPDVEQEQIKIVHAITDKLFDGLGTTTTSSGLIAIARMKEVTVDDCLKSDNPLLLVGDTIQDPGNLGTMIRTSLAFGANGMFLSKGSVDPYNPKVVRGAAGASFALPIVRDLEIDEILSLLKSKSIQTVALDPRAQKSLSEVDFSRPTALIFGNEGHGFSPQVLDKVEDQNPHPDAKDDGIAQCSYFGRHRHVRMCAR